MKIKKGHYTNKAKTKLASMKKTSSNAELGEKRRIFLDKFAMCDAVCKVFLEKYCDVKNSHKCKEDKKTEPRLDMKIIPAALSMFGLTIDKHILTPVFAANYKRGCRSAKILRNGLIHELNSNDMNEVSKRYNELIKQMDEFLAYFI